MAAVEKDVSGHNGTINTNYPTRQENSNDSSNSGTNYSNHAGNGAYFQDEPSDQALKRIRTAGSINISPELFEKLYLSPESKVKGDLRKTFGNPTPIALLGFLLSLTPLSADLMGWRGAGGGTAVGAAGIGTYYWFGGLLMFTGGLLEFVLGNTFPSVVFCSFGAFWFSFGSTLTPAFDSYGAYSTVVGNEAPGLGSPAFASAFAFFLLFMGLLCFVYLICSLRTNIPFFIIFLALTCTFCFLAALYWTLALGNMTLAAHLQKAAGAFAFVACMAGWWIFLAQMLASVDFPIQIPVWDISGMIKGASERQKDAYSV